MRGQKMDLASNGGTSPLHSEYWYHSQKDRWGTVRRLQWRGRGKEVEGTAEEREAAWTCQLHIGDVSKYACATWPRKETMVSGNKFLGAWPAHPVSGRPGGKCRKPPSENYLFSFRLLPVLPLTPPSQNRTIYMIYSDSLMVVSFGNSATNDLYTADTPRA